MVVIAIIAVLISILLPSLAAIRVQVKVAATKATISVIETGIQAFQTDSRCGGSLPPSAPPYGSKWMVYSPYRLDNKLMKIDGASFLLWALAGADLLGTPGFQDLDGDGNWYNNTGNICSTTTLQMYCLDSSGKPSYVRSGPFIDTAKVNVTPVYNPSDAVKLFVVPAAKVNKNIEFPCFLDSFDQPILYYRAAPNKPYMADTFTNINAVSEGTYNLFDYVLVTGVQGTSQGLNFGAGLMPNGTYHYLATLGGVKTTPDEALDWLRNTSIPQIEKRSFAYTIWNPNVVATPRPYNENSYILLSAGHDGIFGTPDDIANFEVNK